MGSIPRGISGSRAAAILGMSDYMTQFEAWLLLEEELHPGFCARRGYVLPEPPDNAAIRFGSAFEDSIIELASAAHGCAIGDRERFYEREYMSCHVDGVYADGRVHEAKTTSLFTFYEGWGEPGTDRVPRIYQCQIQHNMMLAERSESIVSVLVLPRRPEEWEKEGIFVLDTGSLACPKWGHSQSPLGWALVLAEMGFFHQYPCTASHDLQSMLVDAYSHFWHNHVLPEREPEITTYEDVRRAFPEPKGTVILTEQEERWITERAEITQEIGESGRHAKRKKELQRLILMSIRSRTGKPVIDEESQEKIIFVNGQGKKLGSYDGKTFR